MKVVLVGKTASGKSTLGDKLKEMGLVVCESYTDRPKRTEDETGHTFLSPEDFSKVIEEEQVIAYLKKENCRYCTTKELALRSDIFYLDPEAALEFIGNMPEERVAIIVFKELQGSKRLDKMILRMRKNNEEYSGSELGRMALEDNRIFYLIDNPDVFQYKLSKIDVDNKPIFIEIEYNYTDERLEELAQSIYKLIKCRF